ncbi:hypothetical protein LVB87_13020 [Lysobacter sp. KIS68-7]|uniref:hypothetical protein n=1 Tax=Lysobacter sp. KIS68-7 TaxID=2904252 RepID=UPI001E489662|nr:hypothetical protein [Lysobacter sp. KIS68-7]UHQ19096.1 hypothetical protein LVB87_13020 [Lysobacter sp. KIS68-7]
MNVQPLSIVFALIAGLVLAGILGWIRRPRLVVFVPRLFSHSSISDKGQIAEISVMNRGFKTEENVELSLNPLLHFELVGSNNPDATLSRAKLSIPRIGSADDCSVLLQVENGRFSKDDIVSCLSKETKAVVATKLEEVPVTAQQRVGVILFIGAGLLFAFGAIKGIDYYVEKEFGTARGTDESKKTQGWTVLPVYADRDNAIFAAFADGKLRIGTNISTVRRDSADIPFIIENNSSMPLTIDLGITAAAPQDGIAYEKRHVNDKLLLPGDSTTEVLTVALPKEAARRTAVVEVFLSTPSGETLKATRLLGAVDLGVKP